MSDATSPRWVVHKFGGTSLASAERYRNVANILRDRDEKPCAVVVSAMGGLTDMLVGLVEGATARDTMRTIKIEEIRQRLYETVDDLLSHEMAVAMKEQFDQDLEDISDLLRACWLLRSYSKQTMDLVSGSGELWSAQTLHAYLGEQDVKCAWLDARDVLTVIPGAERAPRLLMEQSQEQMNAWLEKHRNADVIVITGFVASTPDGLPTTLGRNGSDYSAAIFSALLDAPELSIWTDVDGVMSANPRLVPEAVVLDSLSYEEAMELAYFGAKVLHPSTIAPAVAKDVVITIKNTFSPQVPGTRIGKDGTSKFAIKGFTTVDDVALVNLEGSNMIGVPGIASRLFGALRDAEVSVIMISQASSEHSICFAVPDAHAPRVREVVEQAFFAERHQGQLQNLDITTSCSILAAVGDQMAGQLGVAGKFMRALGSAGINIRAIAQGSSERNISVVIDAEDSQRALRAVHSSFMLSHKTLSIGLVGAGTVGATLLDQFHEQAEFLRDEFNLDLRVRAIATSEKMLLDEQQISLEDWRGSLENSETVETDLDTLLDHVDADHLPHAVLIDCTASAEVAKRYLGWLERGVHVITPNKKANTAELSFYRDLQAQRRRSRHYLYETTVGAGLPIVQTLRELIQTGDRIERIEGIFSGTLSYLFNMYDGEKAFSEIVAEAKKLGYTEPDPRDDLSGMDVARKVVILGREMGLELELDDVSVEGLVPAALEGASVADFMANLSSYDDEMKARHEAASEANQVLRFVGSVSADGKASVALGQYPIDHPFARIQLTDNIVQFTTRRYHSNPLVVQGPGAGPDVTAGGVFADLLRLASSLGVAR